MNISEIVDAISPLVVARGCYIVEINLGKDNDLTITIESESSTVSLEDCVAVNDCVLAAFDRDKEDYSLTVSSAGLDQPFKILRQYQKAVGSKVEAALKGGKKIIAELSAADGDGIVLKYQAREALEGSKKKVLVDHEDRIEYSEINYVKYHINLSK